MESKRQNPDLTPPAKPAWGGAGSESSNEQFTSTPKIDGLPEKTPATSASAPPMAGSATVASDSKPAAKLAEGQIREQLKDIVDPEIGISIIDLGLIYGVAIVNQDVYISMTLTSPACPLGEVLQQQIQDKIGSLPGVRYVYVELVWDPPWDPTAMCSEEAKLELGIF